MKLKFYIFLSFAFISTGIFAQASKKDTTATNQKITYRAEAGYSQSLLHGSKISSMPYYNIHLGVNAEFKLEYNLGIETGIHYHFGIGSKTQYGGNTVTDTINMTPYNVLDTISYKYSNHSVSVPVHLTYTLPIFWGLKIFAYAGPEFNIGIYHPLDLSASKNSYAVSGNYDLYKDKVTYYKYGQTQKQIGLSRFDIQFGTGGGLQWKSYRVKAGYDWGILNLNTAESGSMHNRGWNVSLEYQF